MVRTILNYLIILLFIFGYTASSASEKHIKNYKEYKSIQKEIIQNWQNEDYVRSVITDYKNHVITNGPLKLSFTSNLFGYERFGTRSLYISMHTGRECCTPPITSTILDGRGMMLFTPKTGVYINLAINPDQWDKGFQTELEKLVEKLIVGAVLVDGVNFNKIYLLGFSSSGRDTWSIAPKFADRFAAIAISGEPQLREAANLSNIAVLPKLAACSQEEDKAKSKGMVTKFMPPKAPRDHVGSIRGHWMDLTNSMAAPCVSQFTRDPYPTKLFFKQGGDPSAVNDYYWLGLPANDHEEGKTVIANIDSQSNVIDIEKSDYKTLTIYLNYEMVNFDEPVVITYHGKKVFNDNVNCTKSVMAKTLSTRKDIAYIFCSELKVKLPKDE